MIFVFIFCTTLAEERDTTVAEDTDNMSNINEIRYGIGA